MNIHQVLKDRSLILFLILLAVFIGNALVAEFVGLKIFSLEKLMGIAPFSMTFFGVDGLGFNLTAGVVLWPVVFVMTDIINEYYGPRLVRFISYLTVFVISFAFIFVWLAILLPPNDWWQYESGMLGSGEGIKDMNLAFRNVMGAGLWIIIGSLVAFLIGQVVDVMTFHKIKNITGENKLWLRATGSTLVSQLIDSFVVLFIAFYIGADWEFTRVLAIGLVNYIYKFIVAIALTPLLYVVHYLIEKYLGVTLANQLKQTAAGQAM
ncbi:MAG: queuosine precursor transporter [Saprospiraceae bacterium]|nr:queuosine precursor transporter [Saprospiraceae bacterium]